jgi:U32 family peptidase
VSSAVSEIEVIAQSATLEVETFVHGALCFCYSGQCLLSSAVGGRSANRGLCAQPCRLPYELLDEKGAQLETPGRYLLSPKDLAGISALPRLVEAGVSAIKIEGRMKSPEYVAIVTGVYRAALDRAVARSRGLRGHRGAGRCPRRGVQPGLHHRVPRRDPGRPAHGVRPTQQPGSPRRQGGSASPGSATVALDKTVEAGDTLEFWTRRGRFGQKVASLQVDGT